MLKHTSSKLELRGGGDTQSDLDDSRDDLLLNISSNTLDNTFTGRTLETPKSSERCLTDILPKPTIQKIIERRKSDFALKDQKPPSPLITSEELPTIAYEHKERADSKDSIQSTKEVIEEVQLDNSTYLIHKRKKADPKQKRNLSDTSTESGIASQVSGSTNKPNDDEQELIANVDAHSDLIEESKQYWESEEDKSNPPVPPIPLSSPPTSSRYTDRNNNSARAPSTTNSYASLEIKEIFRRQEQERADNFDAQSQRSRYSERPRHLQPRQYHMLGNRQPHIYVDTRSGQYLRPTSARTDVYLDNRRYAGSVVGSRSLVSLNMKGRHPQYAQSCCTLPTRGANGHLKRKDTFRSISAGSSISNMPPNYSSASRSVCSCGTLGPGLSEIKEEIPVFHDAFPHKILANENRERKAKYIAIFFIIVAAICCIIGGFLHFYVGYFPEDFDMNQGDVKLLPFSSTFCRGVKGSSDSGEIRLIAFETGSSDTPKTRRLKYSRSKEQFKVNPKQIWKRDFYLLESSKIKITIETDSLIDIFVFQGENSMSIWESRKESESYIFSESCCSNKNPRRGTFEFTASVTDRYYIVLHNRVEIIPVAIKLFRLEIDRLSYDFSDTVASCKTLNGGDCTVEFPLSESNEVAVEVPLVKNSNEISSSISLRYMCVPREWMYFVFFTAMFIICVLVIVAVYYLVIKVCIPSKQCCCYRNDLKKKNREIVYYDNHGRATSELYLDQNFDSVSHARSYAPSTRRSEVKSLYNDTMSQAARYPPSRHTSRSSALPRHAYDNMGHTGSVATLYKDDYVDFETADSGISMIQEQLSPSGISSVTAQEAYNQKYKDARQHRRMQQRAFDLMNGPPVKSLLKDRPRSVASDRQRPNDHRRYRSQPDRHIEYNIEYNLDEFDQFPDHYLQPGSDRVPPVRRHSERIPSSDPYRNGYIFSENHQNEEEDRTKRIDYDDREIFI